MKRSTQKLIWILVLMPFLSLGYTNCSNSAGVSFTENSSEALSEISDGVYEYKKTVKASENKKPLDIVWVVDNSASMNQEADHVRTNLNAFISAVAAVANIKVAVISKKGTAGTHVSIGATSATRMQWDRSVNSENSLIRLAESFEAGGALKSFLRADSQKVFVIVTDDESSISASTFLNRFDRVFPSQKPSVFSFVGFGKSQSPCQYGTGAIYGSLSNQTGGRSFNICETSWSQHFSQLTAEVSSLAVPTVALPELLSKIEIQEISLGGSILSSDDYSLTEKYIQLNPELFSSLRQQSLRIVYRLK